MSTTAQAEPTGYTGVQCDPDGVDVCTYNNATEAWNCDTSKIGDTGAVEAWMVFGETTEKVSDCSNICDGFAYCAWGIQGTTKFYCKLPEVKALTMKTGRLIGLDASDDTLYLQYEEGDNRCTMQHPGPDSTVLPVVGSAVGGSGDDLIYGAWANEFDGSGNLKYKDLLLGDSGDDTIYGREGNDELRGGSGFDDLHGGDGDDKVEGNEDADAISGGDGIDVLVGGIGGDDLCGDAGDDTLFGNAGDDELLGGDNTDTATGHGGTDGCDAETTYLCESGSASPTCPSDVDPYP